MVEGEKNTKLLGQLGLGDYIVFGASLLVTVLIRVFFFLRKKTVSPSKKEEKKNINPVLIAISLALTSFSAVMITEIPKEIFYYGIMFWVATCSEVFGGIMFAFAFAPAFYKSSATTIYEFIDERFRFPPLRILCSFLTLIQLQFSLIIVFHVATKVLSEAVFLAANQDALIYAASILAVVTVFNIVLGGMKAVVVVDTVQYLITLAGVIAMLVVGLQTTENFGASFSKLKEGRHLELFDFTFDVWQRHTFWNLFLGGFTSIMANNMTQTTFLRLRSVGSLTKAIMSTLMFVVIKWILVTMLVFIGLVIYLNFRECSFHLSEASRITLVIDYVQEKVSIIPLMSGLFLAAMMALALSTLSSDITSIATIIWNDFCCQWWKMRMLSKKTQSLVVKGIEIIFVLITAASGFTITEDENLLSFLIAISGSLLGAILGVITLSVYSKQAKATSVMMALLLSVPMTLWWSYGNGAYVSTPTLEISNTCSPLNKSISVVSSSAVTQPSNSIVHEYLYKISYQLYCTVSCFLTLFFGLSFSWFQRSQ